MNGLNKRISGTKELFLNQVAILLTKKRNERRSFVCADLLPNEQTKPRWKNLNYLSRYKIFTLFYGIRISNQIKNIVLANLHNL